MTYRSSARLGLPLLALALSLSLVYTLPALAFGGVISNGPGDYVPPNAAGTGLSEIGPQPWSGFTFWVDQRGEYTVDSHFDDQFSTTAPPGRVVLYRGPMDPSQPLEHLVAVDDTDDEGDSSFDVVLEAGVIYYLVHTVAAPVSDILDFGGGVTGPGEFRYSWCLPPGDETENFDLGEALAFPTRRFDDLCAWVDWKDHQGNTGFGVTAPFRSADSGMFTFFNPDNWEILLKVLDGCGVNGHYWVFLSATTDVEFELGINWESGDFDGARYYRNELGQTAATVTDTAAFPCDDEP